MLEMEKSHGKRFKSHVGCGFFLGFFRILWDVSKGLSIVDFIGKDRSFGQETWPTWHPVT